MAKLTDDATTAVDAAVKAYGERIKKASEDLADLRGATDATNAEVADAVTQYRSKIKKGIGFFVFCCASVLGSATIGISFQSLLSTSPIIPDTSSKWIIFVAGFLLVGFAERSKATG